MTSDTIKINIAAHEKSYYELRRGLFITINQYFENKIPADICRYFRITHRKWERIRKADPSVKTADLFEIGKRIFEVLQSQEQEAKRSRH